MNLSLRWSFLGVSLAFTLLASMLLARITGMLVVAVLAPAAALDLSSSTVPSHAAPRAPLDAVRFAALLGLPWPREAQPASPLDEELPRRSTLQVRLLGTLVSADPSASLAAVHDLEARRAYTLHLGALFAGGAEVLDIQHGRVLVRVGGRRERLDSTPCSPGGDGCAAGPSTGLVEPPRPGGFDLRVQQLGEHEYAVSRHALDGALANIHELAMQVRLVPAYRDGAAVGFKLFSVRPGSVYGQLGVQNGDVVRRINGINLTSPDKALEAYPQLKAARLLDIELERDGVPLTKRVRVD